MIGQTIKHYEIEIILETGIIKDEIGNTFTIKEYDVVAENDRRFCINDEWFTTFDKSKDNYRIHPVLDRESISHDLKDKCWGTRVKYSLYTLKNKRKATIKGKIAEYINDKFGVFANIDLSFLDD